ncbi:hypothetical protein DFH08DRAFT_347401 [Mycena albidolilacea]|uniref:Uncharacterized protein n=1 Tax=Mycena albidolilacea TaxID=1033008 RepID=A0AAD7EH08_9AGAR|nr:hypothetical protein DFH08DRAFT_347401 [Mycena albidolilacea]
MDSLPACGQVHTLTCLGLEAAERWKEMKYARLPFLFRTVPSLPSNPRSAAHTPFASYLVPILMLCLFSICAVAFMAPRTPPSPTTSLCCGTLPEHHSHRPAWRPRTLQLAFIRSLRDSDGLLRNNHLLGIALSLDLTVQLHNLHFPHADSCLL